MQVHDFVTVDNGLGVGQVSAVKSDSVEVSYFDSVLEPIAYTEEVPISRVRPVVLERQRRCFIGRNGSWMPGQVLKHEFGRYELKMPGDRTAWLGPDEFRV